MSNKGMNILFCQLMRSEKIIQMIFPNRMDKIRNVFRKNNFKALIRYVPSHHLRAIFFSNRTRLDNFWPVLLLIVLIRGTFTHRNYRVFSIPKNSFPDEVLFPLFPFLKGQIHRLRKMTRNLLFGRATNQSTARDKPMAPTA